MAKKQSAKKPAGAAKRAKTEAPPRMLIVEARYYEHIADKLLDGATAVLSEAGAAFDRITVPGALEVPPAIAMALAAARAPYDGVVALDGVSLTVNAAEGDTFSVLIIPHTLSVTTLGALKAGDDVNLEIDTMARYAARLLETKT